MLALRHQQLVPRIKHVNFRKALQERGLPEEHLPATTPLCGELLVSYTFDLPEQFVIARLFGAKPPPTAEDPLQVVRDLGLGNWSNVLYHELD